MEASDEVVFRLDFFPDLPLQTNRLAIYDARSVNPLLTPRASYVLTPRIPERAYAA